MHLSQHKLLIAHVQSQLERVRLENSRLRGELSDLTSGRPGKVRARLLHARPAQRVAAARARKRITAAPLRQRRVQPVAPPCCPRACRIRMQPSRQQQLEDWNALDTHLASAMSELVEAQSQAERALIERDAVGIALEDLRAGLDAAGLDHRKYCSAASAEVTVDALQVSAPARAHADMFMSTIAGLPVTLGSPRRPMSPASPGRSDMLNMATAPGNATLRAGDQSASRQAAHLHSTAPVHSSALVERAAPALALDPSTVPDEPDDASQSTSAPASPDSSRVARR